MINRFALQYPLQQQLLLIYLTQRLNYQNNNYLNIFVYIQKLELKYGIWFHRFFWIYHSNRKCGNCFYSLAINVVLKNHLEKLGLPCDEIVFNSLKINIKPMIGSCWMCLEKYVSFDFLPPLPLLDLVLCRIMTTCE